MYLANLQAKKILDEADVRLERTIKDELCLKRGSCSAGDVYYSWNYGFLVQSAEKFHR